MMYGWWDLERDAQTFFIILDHFLHFYPPNNLKKQNFEKMKKKKPLEIASFYTCVP